MSKKRKSTHKKDKLFCITGKLSYKDQISAMLALATLRRRDIVNVRNKDYLKVKRAYKCDKCQYWHLTSKS